MYWYCHEASSWKKKWSRVWVTWLSHNNERFMSLFGSSLLTVLYRGKEFQTTRFSRRVRKILGRISTFFDWLWKAFIRQYLNWKRYTQMINEYHWSYQVTNDSIWVVLCSIILYNLPCCKCTKFVVTCGELFKSNQYKGTTQCNGGV